MPSVFFDKKAILLKAEKIVSKYDRIIIKEPSCQILFIWYGFMEKFYYSF